MLRIFYPIVEFRGYGGYGGYGGMVEFRGSVAHTLMRCCSSWPSY
ncbi:hypothetical protein BCS84_18450 [Vibrio cyclitrophicus]|nr:hypothetical protein [Vibrio cyclitrophicus]